MLTQVKGLNERYFSIAVELDQRIFFVFISFFFDSLVRYNVFFSSSDQFFDGRWANRCHHSSYLHISTFFCLLFFCSVAIDILSWAYQWLHLLSLADPFFWLDFPSLSSVLFHLNFPLMIISVKWSRNLAASSCSSSQSVATDKGISFQSDGNSILFFDFLSFFVAIARVQIDGGQIALWNRPQDGWRFLYPPHK